MEEKRVYHITTEERAYDYVVGKDYFEAREHFKIVRENWNDSSKVLSAYLWDSISGEWVENKVPLRW